MDCPRRFAVNVRKRFDKGFGTRPEAAALPPRRRALNLFCFSQWQVDCKGRALAFGVLKDLREFPELSDHDKGVFNVENTAMM